MQSGKLRQLITIERPTNQQTDAGDVSDGWEPVPGFARIFAEVLPDRAGEFFASRQVVATRNALVRIYYQPGIDETMRVVHHVRPDLDEYWDIGGCVHFQSNNRELRLMCTWRGAEGFRRGDDLEN